MKESAIGWTDYSGNDLNFIVRGSTKGDCECSPGCANCYVLALDERFHFLPEHTTCYPDKLERLRRKRFPKYSPKRGEPYRPMCFVIDLGDLFHKDVPADFITYAFEIMESRKDVIWQILTKRPNRMNEVLFGAEGGHFLGGGDYFENIWLGVSVENWAATWRIGELLRNWLGTSFVSLEPMLEAIDLHLISHIPCKHRGCFSHITHPCEGCGRIGGRLPLDWIIVGAESGPHRRFFDPAWAKDIYDQCQKAGVSFFYKQGSGLYPGMNDELPSVGKIKEWPNETH